jgi:hypothetical protein
LRRKLARFAVAKARAMKLHQAEPKDRSDVFPHNRSRAA